MLPSKTKLNKFYNTFVAFDPRLPGPMKVITDVGNNDFYRRRAIECIHEGSAENLIMAMRLLLLAGAAEDGPEKIK